MSHPAPSADAPGATKRSRWIPWAFVGGFGIVVIANVILVLFALDSWTGLETEQAYQRGLAYNRTLDAATAQAALGWKTTLGFEPSGPSRGRLAVSFVDSAGRPINGLSVSVRLVRPTHEGFDHQVSLVPEAAGRYVVPLELPLPGQWQVRVEARGREAPYRLNGRIVVR